MNLTYDPQFHEYAIDGKLVPGVTEVIRAAGLVPSFGVDDAARDRGKRVAEYIAAICYSETDCGDPEDEVAPYAARWLDFKRDSRIVVVNVESPVCHNGEHRYAGRIDAIVQWPRQEGGLAPARVLEIKTGSPAPWHRLQLEAYNWAYGTSPGSGRLLYLQPGRYFIGPKSTPMESMEDLETFKAALRLWWWKRSHSIL